MPEHPTRRIPDGKRVTWTVSSGPNVRGVVRLYDVQTAAEPVLPRTIRRYVVDCDDGKQRTPRASVLELANPDKVVEVDP